MSRRASAPQRIERKAAASPVVEHKSVALTNGGIDDTGPGHLYGYASTFNGVDSYKDSVAPGAYKNTIPRFLESGAILWAHDDQRFPIAYPTKAEERPEGLWLEATFHGDPEAQRARSIIKERLDAGKTMGLSIGYISKKHERTKEGNRRMLEIDLVEVSAVIAPSDRRARVISIKADGTSVETEVPPDPETEDDAPEHGEAPPESQDDDLELKPFPNEHACRKADPGGFEPDSFRRVQRDHNGKSYSVIMGKAKGQDAMSEQAYRYPRDQWTAAQASAHCDEHDGKSFEPASQKSRDAYDAAHYGHGVSWADQLDEALVQLGRAEDALTGLHIRAVAQEDIERKADRHLAAEHRTYLESVLGAEAALSHRFAALRALWESTAPPTHGPDMRLALKRVELRLRGITSEGGE